MRPTIGTKVLVLRCMFCDRRVGDHVFYSESRIYPPGQTTFGLFIKCPKCKMTTKF